MLVRTIRPGLMGVAGEEIYSKREMPARTIRLGHRRVMPVRTIHPGWIGVAGEEIYSRRVNASRDNPSWMERCDRRGDL
jgi:hypothetical protein